MPRDEFFQDIRRAVSFMAPRVEADSPFTNTNYIKRMLRGADLWVSPKVVKAFRPEDYPDLDKGTREDLARAVGDFLNVARTVPANAPAKREQREAAIEPFKRIIQRVQILVREDWLKISAALLAEAEEWARDAGWPTKRFPKEIAEDFIGSYKQERLLYSAEGAQLALIPVGRYAPGTDGLFDLAVLPAYDSAMVLRQAGRWFIHPVPGEKKRQDWSKEAFLSTSLSLARLP